MYRYQKLPKNVTVLEIARAFLIFGTLVSNNIDVSNCPVLRYCSVVWNGAAETHMKRMERVQHRFLAWLGHRFRATNMSSYEDLLRIFKVERLAARRTQHDILFIRNVHRHVIDSSFLLAHLPLSVPTRLFRQRAVFNVPFGRTNTIKNSFFSRAPRLCNEFLDRNRDIDLWTDSRGTFRKRLLRHVHAA